MHLGNSNKCIIKKQKTFSVLYFDFLINIIYYCIINFNIFMKITSLQYSFSPQTTLSMRTLTINHVAVWLLALIHQLVSFGWYTIFGDAWMRLLQKTESDFGNPEVMPFVISFIASLVVNYTLAWLWKALPVDSANRGFQLSALVALAFVMLPFAVNNLFSLRPLGLALIDGGNYAVNIIFSGVLLGAWRKYADS